MLAWIGALALSLGLAYLAALVLFVAAALRGIESLLAAVPWIAMLFVAVLLVAFQGFQP